MISLQQRDTTKTNTNIHDHGNFESWASRSRKYRHYFVHRQCAYDYMRSIIDFEFPSYKLPSIVNDNLLRKCRRKQIRARVENYVENPWCNLCRYSHYPFVLCHPFLIYWLNSIVDLWSPYSLPCYQFHSIFRLRKGVSTSSDYSFLSHLYSINFSIFFSMLSDFKAFATHLIGMEILAILPFRPVAARSLLASPEYTFQWKKGW